jgi:uncharacterized protein (TIGR02722 family)
MKLKLIIFFAFLVLALSGCATTSSGPVSYQDPGSAKPITTDFGFSDLNQIAVVMVDDMLSHPATVDITRSRRPLVVVGKIQNRSDQHVDTKSITDSISTQVLRSGKFRFTKTDSRQQIKDEIDYQNNSGMVNQKTATAEGQGIGAEYIITGSLVSYTARTSGTLEKSYKFTMELVNLQTGVIEWVNEVKIRKVHKRGVFGS